MSGMRVGIAITVSIGQISGIIIPNSLLTDARGMVTIALSLSVVRGKAAGVMSKIQGGPRATRLACHSRRGMVLTMMDIGCIRLTQCGNALSSRGNTSLSKPRPKMRLSTLRQKRQNRLQKRQSRQNRLQAIATQYRNGILPLRSIGQLPSITRPQYTEVAKRMASIAGILGVAQDRGVDVS